MDSWFEIHVLLIEKETDKAFKLHLEEGTEWMPKSQIKEPENYSEDMFDLEMEITDWIAEQKGLK
jgi:hypothetical protein